MTTVMAQPITKERPEWQRGHIPRLSYRNPIPAGESVAQRDKTIETLVTKDPSGGLSIREIREQALRQTVSHERSPTLSQSPTSPVVGQQERKKKSFLRGFFEVEEPTKVAMAELNRRMGDQHGSLTPAIVGNVSYQKLPNHVPRVNSKWDGVPEYVKMREKQERERAKYASRDSMDPGNTRIRSSDQDESTGALRRRGSHAPSYSESWDSRSTGSRPVFNDNAAMCPESISSNSSENSIRRSEQTTPIMAQPYMTLTIPKSPETLSSYTDGISLSSGGSQRWRSSQSVLTQSTSSSNQSRFDLPKNVSPAINAVPEYTSSPDLTPLEFSPQTPAPFSEDESSLESQFKSGSVLPGEISRRKSIKLPLIGRKNDTKPAEHARKVSRTGISQRSKNVVAPWESQQPSSPQSDQVVSPRSKSRLFGKERK